MILSKMCINVLHEMVQDVCMIHAFVIVQWIFTFLFLERQVSEFMLVKSDLVCA